MTRSIGTGNKIWIDAEFAAAEGIDVERMKQFYAERGITLVTEQAYYLEEEGRWVCPGCMRAWERNNEVWRRSEIVAYGDWAPMCRECEGILLSNKPEDVKSRQAAEQRRLANPNYKPKGRYTKRVKPKMGSVGVRTSKQLRRNVEQ